MPIIKDQKIKKFRTKGNQRLEVTIRHDDECGNGHNMFSITGTLSFKAGNHRFYERAWGCLHDEVREFFPELAPFIKWHLCSTDGPMHYVANTMYFASTVHDVHHFIYISDPVLKHNKEILLGLYDDVGRAQVENRFSDFKLRVKTEPTHRYHEPNLEAARNAAVWPDATLEQLQDRAALEARLPALLEEFRRDVESLGMVF